MDRDPGGRYALKQTFEFVSCALVFRIITSDAVPASHNPAGWREQHILRHYVYFKGNEHLSLWIVKYRQIFQVVRLDEAFNPGLVDIQRDQIESHVLVA